MYVHALHQLPSINDTDRFLNYPTYMAMTDEIVLCSKSTVFTKTENTQKHTYMQYESFVAFKLPG